MVGIDMVLIDAKIDTKILSWYGQFKILVLTCGKHFDSVKFGYLHVNFWQLLLILIDS
jgi:hypothetical protein